MDRCEYCGQEFIEYRKGDGCKNCGAKKIDINETNKQNGPFFYNGTVYYVIDEMLLNSLRFVFYSGVELIADILVSREYLERFSPMEDFMFHVYDLFELSQGYKDNIKYMIKNKRGKYFNFTVKCEPVDDYSPMVRIDNYELMRIINE